MGMSKIVKVKCTVDCERNKCYKQNCKEDSHLDIKKGSV